MVYVGFVVVSIILNDIDERFLSDDKETPTKVVESTSESETEPIVAPKPESTPKVNKEKRKIAKLQYLINLESVSPLDLLK